MFDALVIGGGIAGLTTAYDLTRAGKRVCLVEQRPRLGGLIHTEHTDGLTIEAGPDALLMQKPAAGKLCEELGLPLVPTKAPRTAYVLRDGRFIPLPTESVLGIPIAWRSIIAAAMLSPAGRARLALDFVQPAEPSPARDGDDRRRVGRRVRAAAVRRRGRALHRAAAARRHSCRRRRPPVAARALSNPRRGRSAAGQRPAHARRAASAGRERSGGCVPIDPERAERSRRRAERSSAIKAASGPASA